MVPRDILFVVLVSLIDLILSLPEPFQLRCGLPKTYPDRLFLKVQVIMIIRHVHTPSGMAESDPGAVPTTNLIRVMRMFNASMIQRIQRMEMARGEMVVLRSFAGTLRTTTRSVQ